MEILEYYSTFDLTSQQLTFRMVGKTRSQAAKVARKSFQDNSTPPDDIQIRLEEVMAYFEVQVENGGLIE